MQKSYFLGDDWKLGETVAAAVAEEVNWSAQLGQSNLLQILLKMGIKDLSLIFWVNKFLGWHTFGWMAGNPIKPL